MNLSLALLLAFTTSAFNPVAPQAGHSRTHFVAFSRAEIKRGIGEMNTSEMTKQIMRIGPIDPGFEWTEAVFSYNIRGKAVEYDIRPFVWLRHSPKSTSFFMGTWAPRRTAFERTSSSEPPIGLSIGKVDVDTIVLNTPARELLMNIQEDPGDKTAYPLRFSKPKIPLVGAVLTDTRQPLPPYASTPPNPIKPLDVPERCQMDYKDGDQHCSPTALAMSLAYWSYQLHRPELTRDVNEIIQDVYDKEYKGSGNWSFNVAYAGQFPGIRAYVTRLEQIEELEAWLKKGVPVICSGSLFLLEGRPRPAKDPGHLFVLVGFDPNGDPIVNDPGRFRVRQTYKLADFENAWNTSGRTVYLIYPEKVKEPPDYFHHWFSGQ